MFDQHIKVLEKEIREEIQVMARDMEFPRFQGSADQAKRDKYGSKML